MRALLDTITLTHTHKKKDWKSSNLSVERRARKISKIPEGQQQSGNTGPLNSGALLLW